MAIIRDIIARVDDVKPNAFKEQTKLAWIGELDGRVAADVMLMGIEDIRQIEYTHPDSLEVKPLVEFPHDAIYEHYLCAKIDYANGEYSKYQNSMEMFNAHYENFINWFIRNYAPAHGYSCGASGKQPYYISAYGLAVQQGYDGTLEEWLESLHGKPVELRSADDVVQWRFQGEAEESWQSLFDMATIRTAIFRKAKPKDVIITAEFEDAQLDEATGSMVSNGASSMTAVEIATAIRSGATVKLIDNEYIVYEYDGYLLEPSTNIAHFKAEVPSEEGIKVYRVNIDNELYAGRVETLIAYGGGGDSYYSTTREKLGTAHENVTAEYIYGLYDALMEEHPNDVQKNEVHNDDGSFTNYEYVISTGEYTADALYAEQYGADPNIKKPKYLISSGIHGTERNAVLSAYRFIRDVLRGHNVPKSFKEGAIIHIMPVGTPSAFNRFTRENGDNIDINRNFSSATPAKETQAIKNWLNTNADADLYIDFHNNGAVQEVVAILGDSDNDAVDMVKKIALKGVDRIIPFWKDVIGYPPVEAPYFDGTEIKTEVRDVIFSYCANAQIDGSAQMYASNALSIPSTTIEVSVYYGDYSDWDSSTETYPPETIAAGAEAIGNILLEFYEQSFVGEVIDDMKEVNDKLDDLLAQVNSGFHVESGVLVVGADVTDPTDSIIEIKIPCTNGAKMLTFQPDGDTLNLITQNTSADDGVNWLVGAMGNCVTQVGSRANRGYMQRMDNLVYGGKNYWTPTEVGGACDNSDGFTLSANGLKAGTYNWTAYYWNE